MEDGDLEEVRPSEFHGKGRGGKPKKRRFAVERFPGLAERTGQGLGGRQRHGCSRMHTDGVPVDGSAVAREAGIRYPVALTRAVWERCVSVPPGVVRQDEAGRLWDLLWMLRLAIASTDGSTPPVDVNLLVLEVTTSNIQAQLLAQTGDGQILGNLLYHVANLLNPGGVASLLALLNALGV